jgi:hypothetical protein
VQDREGEDQRCRGLPPLALETADRDHARVSIPTQQGPYANRARQVEQLDRLPGAYPRHARVPGRLCWDVDFPDLERTDHQPGCAH